MNTEFIQFNFEGNDIPAALPQAQNKIFIYGVEISYAAPSVHKFPERSGAAKNKTLLTQLFTHDSLRECDKFLAE